MKKSQLLLAVLLSVILIQTSCTQSNKTGFFEKVGLSGDTLQLASEKLQSYIDYGKLGGISALIYKNGETVYFENFGYLNLNEKIPMDETAIFRIFSMTKPIT